MTKNIRSVSFVWVVMLVIVALIAGGLIGAYSALRPHTYTVHDIIQIRGAGISAFDAAAVGKGTCTVDDKPWWGWNIECRIGLTSNSTILITVALYNKAEYNLQLRGVARSNSSILTSIQNNETLVVPGFFPRIDLYSPTELNLAWHVPTNTQSEVGADFNITVDTPV